MRRVIIILLFMAISLPLAPFARAGSRAGKLPPSTRLVLENGFEVILIPNRGAPLVTSVVVVRAGSLRETPETSGLSHMLEHLLFNGTARRTQEQIYDEQDRYGIINNAHTAATHTAFFVMSTRAECHRALDLQADMLFGSTIPEEKLAKEREIIVNEIAKDRTRDDTKMSEMYAARLYGPGPAALPVIGTPETVRGIGREAILAYYHAWYVPDNMTAVIMGDFDTTEMEQLARRVFGQAPPGLLPPPSAGQVSATAAGRVNAARTSGSSRMLWLGAPAPGMGQETYPAAFMLASLVGEDLVDAANARLAAAEAEGSFLEAGVDIDAFGGFGSFQVRAKIDSKLAWDKAIDTLRDEVTGRLAAGGWKGADLDRIRLNEKAQTMRLWEKPHYFGLDRAPYIAAGGWDLARDFTRNLGYIEPGDLKDLARPIARPDRWAVFAVGPDAPSDTPHEAPAAPQAAATGDRAQQRPTPASRSLVARWEKRTPSAPPAGLPPALAPSPPAAAGAVTARFSLDNGLSVILDVSDDSRVFAAHALIRNRSAAEPAGKEGIAELLHRLAGEGTRAHPGARLADRLRAIGGSLKVADDPYIPYDDIYLSPEYSYIRLEALDEFAEEAIGLLGEILSEPDLPSDADDRRFVSAREALAARAAQADASPRDRSRLLLAAGLWGEGHPFAKPIFGTEASVRSITPADLEAFRRVYFSPRNIIVGIGTSIPSGRILPVIEAKLGRFGRDPAVEPPAPAPAPVAAGGGDAAEPRERTATLSSSQAYLRWGRLVAADARTSATVGSLAAVLSRRMGDVLREQRGLSYSLGAEAAPMGDRLVFTTWMGAVPDSLGEARAGVREMLLSLIEKPPTQEEIDDAFRSSEVRVLMRGLSRINRAYMACIAQMRRESGPAVRGAAEPPPAVTESAVTRLAKSLVVPGGLGAWVEAVVGP